MIKYSIYTENKNLEKIKKILNTSIVIKGYTLINTIGYYEGQEEQGLKIEILLPKHYNWIIKSICNKIRIINNQQSVLCSVEEIKAKFIDKSFFDF